MLQWAVDRKRTLGTNDPAINSAIPDNKLDEKLLKYYGQFLAQADIWVPKALKKALDQQKIQEKPK